PSLLAALARHGAALNATLQSAAAHRQQRDAVAWIGEWLTLPQLILATARALAAGTELASGLTPVPERMAALLQADGGTIHAEALSFALSAHMPRPEAQAAVKALCAEALASGTQLLDLAARRWPDLGLSAAGSLGTAPAEARAFAARAAML